MINSSVIILAAGESKRLGYPKGLIQTPIQNKLWLEVQLEKLKNLFDEKLILVLGYHQQKYLSQLPNLINKVQVVFNPHPERGAFSSLLCGLEKTRDFPVFILPVDVPVAEDVLWKSMLQKLEDHQVVIPTYKGNGGHPVLLSKNFSEHLLLKEPSGRLDFEIKSLNESEVLGLETQDSRVCMNLNTAQDFSSYFNETIKAPAIERITPVIL